MPINVIARPGGVWAPGRYVRAFHSFLARCLGGRPFLAYYFLVGQASCPYGVPGRLSSIRVCCFLVSFWLFFGPGPGLGSVFFLLCSAYPNSSRWCAAFPFLTFPPSIPLAFSRATFVNYFCPKQPPPVPRS